MTPAKRFKESRKYLGLSQQELADKLNFKSYKIKDIEIEKQKVTPEIAELLERNFSISGWWLLTGNGEMFISSNKSPQKIKGNNNISINGSSNNLSNIQNNKQNDELESNLVEIPYFQDTYAAAGAGALNYDEVPRPIAFDSTFLQTQLKISTLKNIHIINAIGNSMEPTIKEGELLFINPFENESYQINDGGIYVINCNNGVLVKRINHNPINGNIVLVSDNKSVADISITGDEFDSCKIMGRVVGHFSSI